MIFRLISTSILVCFLGCAASNKISPSVEANQPIPIYWSSNNIEGLIDPGNCRSNFQIPRLVGGISELEDKIKFPDDGKQYSQRITAAFIIDTDGQANRIWFPYHSHSIATDAVKAAINESRFKPAFCNGEAGISKFSLTVHAHN